MKIQDRVNYISFYPNGNFVRPLIEIGKPLDMQKAYKLQ